MNPDTSRTEAEALHQDAIAALRQLADVLRRQQEVLQDTRKVHDALESIRHSQSWRALERFRRLRLQAQRLRWRAGFLGPLPRRAGVPAAVRRMPLGVNVSGYITAESGMGEAVRSSIRALELAGVPFVLDNIGSDQRTHDTSYVDFSKESPHPFNLVHLNADNMAAFARAKGRRYFRDRYTIGFWFWELGRFRGDWVPAFRFVDEVWVASRFTQTAVEALSPVPVIRMPLAITAPDPLPLGRSHFGIPDRAFVFLFIFDVSSQTARKNPLGILRAFRQARFAHEDAVLVLKFTNAGFDRAGTGRLYQEAIGLNVLMLDGFMDRRELTGLLNSADAYVSLHRAEGFGLTLAEAMALGKPVIATGYSANMDFMTPANSYPVNYHLSTLSRNHGPYPRGFTWAEPDLEHAAALMREVATDRVKAQRIGRQASLDVRAQFSPTRVAERIAGRLQDLLTSADGRSLH